MLLFTINSKPITEEWNEEYMDMSEYKDKFDCASFPAHFKPTGVLQRTSMYFKYLKNN